jgi:hypothetical protein
LVVKRESRKFQNDQIFSNSMMSVDVRCKVGQRVDLLENKIVYFALHRDINTYTLSMKFSKQQTVISMKFSKQQTIISMKFSKQQTIIHYFFLQK